MNQPRPRGRVLVVTRSIAFDEGIGGLERAVSDQIRALKRIGWEVTLAAPSQFVKGTPTVEVIDVPWPLKLLSPGRPGFGLAYWLWVRRLSRTLRRKVTEYDALYLHGASAGVLRRLGDSRAGIPTIANPHGMEEFRAGGVLKWSNRVFTRYLARGAKYADFVLATDAELVADVSRFLDPEPTRIKVLPNAVDVARLDGLALEGASSVVTPAEIVSVGRLVNNKGYDLLADALRIIQSSDGAAPLLWRHFGKGDQSDAILRKADSTPNLSFELVTGASDAEVQANIRAAGLFVQPSRYEGSSLTTLEAMAQRAVCVGTPVGGIPEKLDDGITGFLATDVSADAIAEAICRARLADRAIGEVARERVIERFGIDALARGLSELLSATPQIEIAQVARHVGPGTGVASVVYALDREFQAQGRPTRTVTLAHTGIKTQAPISRNPVVKAQLLAEVLWFSIIGSLKVWSLGRLYPNTRIIVHGDPIGGDIYVNHGLMKGVVRRRAQGKVVYVPLNPMHWFTLARDEYRYSHSRQRSIVCLSRNDVEELHALYPKNASPIHLIPNGIDLSEYNISPLEEKRRARSELGLPDDCFIVLFVGHEYSRKGLFETFEALRTIREDVMLLVVGGTPEMVQDAKSRADLLGLAKRVRLVGSQADPRGFYAVADAFVLPSDHESAALVILEALACGLPVVATPVGLAPELVKPGVNGYLIDRTPQAIAHGLSEVHSLVLRGGDSLSAVCRDSVRPYAWSEIADQYAELATRAR